MGLSDGYGSTDDIPDAAFNLTKEERDRQESRMRVLELLAPFIAQRRRALKAIDRWVNIQRRDPCDPRIDRILERVGIRTTVKPPKPDTVKITGKPTNPVGIAQSNMFLSSRTLSNPFVMKSVHKTFSIPSYADILVPSVIGKHFKIMHMILSASHDCSFELYGYDPQSQYHTLSPKFWVHAVSSVDLNPNITVPVDCDIRVSVRSSTAQAELIVMMDYTEA